MELDLAALPQEVDALHRLIRELVAERTGKHKALTEAQAEIEWLRLVVQKLQRQQFGRRAERLDEGQRDGRLRRTRECPAGGRTTARPARRRGT